MISEMLNIVSTNKALILSGIEVTLLLAIVGTVVGLLFGILVAIYRVIPIEKQHNKFIRFLYKIGYALTTIYVEVFRSTPLMVQAVLIYYTIVDLSGGTRINPVIFGLCLLSINTGAYMAEIVRGGIISIDDGQYEAAHSVGLTHWQTMKGIVMPQALRNIMPAVGNEFIINMKDSCVLSVVAVSELFFTMKSIASGNYQYTKSYLIAAIIYLILTLITTKILKRIEKKMDGEQHYELYVDKEANANA